MEDDHTAYHLNPNGLVDVFHENPVLRAFMLFVQTARVVAKYKDAVFCRKAGLSDVKFMVLMAINQSTSGILTPSEVAQWTQTEPHNITTLIRRMKKDGLIEAERNERDRRLVSVTLTDKGRKVFNQAIPPAREIISQVMSSISQADAVQLEEYLKTLRLNARRAMDVIRIDEKSNKAIIKYQKDCMGC